MFKNINNDNGIALMMVLILLILVGGLTAALMSAGVFNIRYGGDEVERTQAFYAADAGVEYINNRIYSRDRDFDGIKSALENYSDPQDYLFNEFNNNSNYMFLNGDNIWFEEPEFNINNNSIIFKVTGVDNRANNNIQERIEIEFIKPGSDKTFQVESETGTEALKGQADTLYPDHIEILPEIFPPYEWWTSWQNQLPGEEAGQDKEHHHYDVYDSGGHDTRFKDDYTDWLSSVPDDKKGSNNGSEFLDSEFKFSAKIQTETNQGEPGKFNLNNQTSPDTDIHNLVLVVDGDLEINPQHKIYNSVFIVKGDLTFNGAPTDYLERSMFYVYGNVDVDADLHIGGNPKDGFDNAGIPQIDGLDLESELNKGVLVNWRQIR